VCTEIVESQPLTERQDYFKIFMGLPTTGGAPPKVEKA
jgi:hypothetical protein